MKTMIAEAVAKELADKKEVDQSEKEAEEQLHQYLVALVESSNLGKRGKPNGGISAADAKDTGTDSKSSAVTLSKIMRRVQFKKNDSQE
jgi:hypothetical protein